MGSKKKDLPSIYIPDKELYTTEVARCITAATHKHALVSEHCHINKS